MDEGLSLSLSRQAFPSQRCCLRPLARQQQTGPQVPPPERGMVCTAPKHLPCSSACLHAARNASQVQGLAHSRQPKEGGALPKHSS